MAVYIVHASLLLIFAGGIIDGVFGYSGFLALHKGQTDNVIELRNGGKMQLPFAVKCYAAGQENYADGSPKKWWSKLAVVENGKEVRVQRNRGERSSGLSGIALLPVQLLDRQPTPSDSPANCLGRQRRQGKLREITLQMNQPLHWIPTPPSRWLSTFPTAFVRDDQVFKKLRRYRESGVSAWR